MVTAETKVNTSKTGQEGAERSYICCASADARTIASSLLCAEASFPGNTDIWPYIPGEYRCKGKGNWFYDAFPSAKPLRKMNGTFV